MTMNSQDNKGIAIQDIIKKKNRFGLYYKRIVTLTEGAKPRVGYSQDPLNIFRKVIVLGMDSKVVRFE